jgi:tRNA/rRNA methyltransferase
MSKKTKIFKSDLAAPTIILVGAQLGENIGTVARAMLNFGLTDLRLVHPRAGWQLDRAIKASAGADALIENRREFDDLDGAIADLDFVVATSARLRDMVKPVMTPARVAVEIQNKARIAAKTGIVFGCERTGLDNEDISRADVLCQVPINPDFSSLNLAQAVLLLSYEWYQHANTAVAEDLPLPDTRPAKHAEITGMLTHFEAALDASGFLAPPEKKPAMMRNIRNMFLRARLTEQDIRTFRGIINSLLRWPRNEDHSEIKRRVGRIAMGLPDSEDLQDTAAQEDETTITVADVSASK